MAAFIGNIEEETERAKAKEYVADMIAQGRAKPYWNEDNEAVLEMTGKGLRRVLDPIAS
jgi:hypothetical protein